MSDELSPLWTLNGETGIGWRIDEVTPKKAGLDFLTNPVAIVPILSTAKLIAQLPEMQREIVNLKKQVTVLQSLLTEENTT